MNKQQEHYINLIVKQLSGNADDSENIELKKWIALSADNQKLYDEYKQLWETYPFNSDDQEIISTDKKSAWKNINERIINEQEKDTKTVSFRQSSRAVLYTLSGIAAMFLLFWGLYYLLPGSSSPRMITHEIKSGEKQVLTLPDGSEVSFNGESTITFSENFKGNQRIVEFSGQAFFEIAENPQKPFIIELKKTPNATVEVVGTSFYINETVAKNSQVEVEVLTGRVKFADKTTFLLLGKDERGTLDILTHEMKKDSIFHYNFLAWKTGILQFTESPLSEVFQSLEETYHIHIAASGPVNEKKLTARFENEKPEDIFKTLSLLFGLEIEKTDQDQYLVYGNSNNDYMNK